MVKAVNPKLSPKAAVIVKVRSIYETMPGPNAGKEVT
jgi:predicted pyridoxine 5'-phosphate oxidase superfamily flavin-nucleotide-binding protein